MDIDKGESGFNVSKHVACIAHTCIAATADKKRSTLGIKANEHYVLMMVHDIESSEYCKICFLCIQN